MDLSELKAKIAQASGKGGPNRFSPELQRQVVEAAETSEMERRQFLLEIGLTPGSFYVMRSAIKARTKFRQIKVTPREVAKTWDVTGPGGLRITCQSVNEVVQLWRALC